MAQLQIDGGGYYLKTHNLKDDIFHIAYLNSALNAKTQLDHMFLGQEQAFHIRQPIDVILVVVVVAVGEATESDTT